MKRVVRGALGLGASGLAMLLLLALLLPLPARLGRPSSTVVLDREGQWMRVWVTPDDGGMVRIPVELDELPEALVEAVLTFEDRRFHLHPGVDPLAMIRAAWLNLSSGRVVSGGSTLTMQVARMLERRPRTLSAKALEMFRAVQLELRYSKEEILTHYFNMAPYGGNLEGVGSAAFFYYGKPVTRLALDEVATLAALPNAPSLLDPRRGGERLLARRNDVLTRLARDGKLAAEEAEAAKAVPIHAARQPFPMVAPHLAERIRREHPGRSRLVTSIDRALQEKVERLLADHVGQLETHGITNGAVVIIENETRAVRAYAGSRSFFDAGISGQVDGADALRSPGSTLKPFVYALAFDRGLIGVNTLLEDVPIAYKNWAPGNFDGRFRGVVAARTALAESLNVPAVKLAERLEPDGLLHLLEGAGFRALRGGGAGRYGLAAVLGGIDVGLLELTNLYATLAQGGLHRPWTLLAEGDRAEPVRLFSEAAAHLTTEILTDVRRPELPEAWRDAVSAPRLAWKTGTSYGRRDAWSIGYDGRFTIGVWIGNFDGRGVPELVGVGAAAPLLFTLARALPEVGGDPRRDPPEGLTTRSVCALSGAPPGASCPHVTTELALEGVAPREICKLHVRLEVDDDSGHRLCPACRSGRHSHPEVHVVWPAAVAGHMARAGWALAQVPGHHPECTQALAGDGPAIRAPLDGDVFVIRPGVPTDQQQIALVASAESGAGDLFWFADEALLARAAPGQPVLFEPRPGLHRLVVMDREGRRAAVTISIR